MSASYSGLNLAKGSFEFSGLVARFLAIGFGVVYGFTHQRSIWAAAKVQAKQHEYEHKQHLIEQAKEEFKRQNGAKADTGSVSVVMDPSNPKYDPEAHLRAIV